VQPAKPIDPLCGGPQHQMVGVAEDHVRTRRAHVGRLHRLDRRRRSYRHEGRRADVATHEAQRAGARGAIDGVDAELEAGACGHRGGIAVAARWVEAVVRG